MRRGNRSRSEIICLCNEVSKDQIELALKAGARTLNEIFDHTTAGVGACGGSCRGKLQVLLEDYLKSKLPTAEPTAQTNTKDSKSDS